MQALADSSFQLPLYFETSMFSFVDFVFGVLGILKVLEVYCCYLCACVAICLELYICGG